MASLYWRPPATAPAPQTTWVVSWVITACTPGKLEASLVSMRRMRAWGWGLRSTRAYNIPGNLISLVYLACPVTRAMASTRGVTWPMVVKGRTASLTPHPLLCASGDHSLDDGIIVRAATEIPDEGLLHLRRIWPGDRVEPCGGRHELTRRAKPTLWGIVIDEGLLQWRQPSVVRQTLNRLHVCPIGPDRELTAGIHRLTVHQHGAGTTFAAVTADFGAGEIKLVTEQFHQGPAVLHLDAMTDAVHGKSDRCCGRKGCVGRMRNWPPLAALPLRRRRRASGQRRCCGTALLRWWTIALLARAASVGRIAHGFAPALKRALL